MFADVLLPLSLTLIMGSLGLTLTTADFRRVVTAPRGVGIGLVNLLLISPLLAFLVADVYGLAAALAVGVVLLGASPGGTTANLLTHLARGDVALSVSMTAVSSVASVITVPLFLSLSAEYFNAQDISDEISMPGIAARVFFITIVPLSIGMLIRARRTEWALANMQRARAIALGAFVIVVAGAIVTEFDKISDAFGEIAAAVITLNVLAMTVSFFIARAARLDNRQSTAIAMELGVHNTTVALAIATTVDDELAGPAAVYGLFMFFTAGLFAKLMARRNAGAEPAEPAEPSETAGPPGARVEVSTEVAAPAEAAWRAVSTAGGLTSWFAPTRLDGDQLVMSLGGLGRARSRVVADEPPRFAFAEERWLDGAAPLVTEFVVEELDHRRSLVRIVNRVEGERRADVDEALASTELAWRPYLAVLRMHLADHAGDTAESVDVTAAPGAGSVGDAWTATLDALGLEGQLEPGSRVRVTAPAAPDVSGTVEHAAGHELVLKLAGPVRGQALLAAYDGPDGPLVTLHAWLYGPEAADVADRARREWQAFLDDRLAAGSAARR